MALINGTTIFTGMAALNCFDAEQLIKQSEIACALSLEAMRGEQAAFDPRIPVSYTHLDVYKRQYHRYSDQSGHFRHSYAKRQYC